MWRASSLKKTLILEKTEGKRGGGRQRMRWLDGITNSMDMSLSKHQEMMKVRAAWHAAVHGVSKSQTRLSKSNSNMRPVGRGSFSLKALRGPIIQAVNLSCLPLDGMVRGGLPGENCRNPGPSLGEGSFPLNLLILTLGWTCKTLGRLIKPEGQDQPQTNKSEFGAMIP